MTGNPKTPRRFNPRLTPPGSLGGTVYFPPGKQSSGTVRLRSHVTVFLDAGATLVSSPDKEDFDPYEKLDFKSYSDDETTDFHYALLRGQEVSTLASLDRARLTVTDRSAADQNPSR